MYSNNHCCPEISAWPLRNWLAGKVCVTSSLVSARIPPSTFIWVLAAALPRTRWPVLTKPQLAGFSPQPEADSAKILCQGQLRPGIDAHHLRVRRHNQETIEILCLVLQQFYLSQAWPYSKKYHQIRWLQTLIPNCTGCKCVTDWIYYKKFWTGGIF